MRFAYALALPASLLFAPLAPCADAPHPAAVQVIVARGPALAACGSGTVISAEDGRSLVLTCAHVADGDYPTKVVLAGVAYPAVRVAGSRVTTTQPGQIRVDGPDLALLEVDAELPAAEIADAEPGVGSRLRQWGFGGGHLIPREGTNRGYGRLGTADNRVLATDLGAVGGDSGAGLFDDDGRLVAVVWGVDTDTSIQCCTGTTTVRTFVRTHAGPRFPRLGARLAGRSVTVTRTMPAAQPVPAAKPMPPVALPKPMEPAKPAPKATPAAPKAGDCPTGTCPLPRMGANGTVTYYHYGYSTGRRGLFGRW